MHDQFGGATGSRKRRLKYARDPLEDGTPFSPVREVGAVEKVHAGRQIELVANHMEFDNIGCYPRLVWLG